MADAMLGCMNAATWGTLAVSAASAGHGADLIKTQHGAASHAWQTPGGDINGRLRIDAGVDTFPWRALGLFRTNLSPGAIVTWMLGNDTDFLTPVYDSGPLASTVMDGYGQSVHVLPADIQARYAHVDILDTQNPEAFLSVPLVYAGPMIPRARVGLGTGTSHGRDRDELVTRSRAGQDYVTLRSMRRRWTVEFPTLDAEGEFWPGIAEVERVAADGTNVLLIPFPNSVQMPREAVFGRLAASQDAGWPQVNEVRQRSWSGIIVERL